jgi:hypothetical protein
LDALLNLTYEQVCRSKRSCDPENPTLDTLAFAELRFSKQLERDFSISVHLTLEDAQGEIGSPTNSTTMSPAPSLSRQFLNLLNGAIDSQNGETLKTLLPIEPPFQPDYLKLLEEVFTLFSDVDALKDAIKNGTNAATIDDKDSWQAFPEFLATWFQFVKTVNPANLLETYEKLTNLLK